MAETVLAVLGLIGPTYEAISLAYTVCRSMQNYGRDMCEYSGNLEAQWVIFEGLMHRPVCDYKQPFDWTDENDGTTKAILELLRILEHQFGLCRNIVQKICVSPESGVFLRYRHLHPGTRIDKAVMAATLTIGVGPSKLLIHTRGIQRPITLNLLSPGVDDERTLLRSPSPGSRKLENDHHHPSTWTRLTWALRDKSEMEKAIARIRQTVSDLKALLELRASRESHKIIPENMITTTSQARTNPMRSLYMNVHRALCEANKRSERPVSFAICAAEDVEDNWSRLDNKTKLRLRLGCAALWLQMHVSAEESTFWMAEVRLPEKSTVSQSIDLPLIESLDKLPHVYPMNDAEEHYEVGALLNKFEPTDKIHVFAHTSPCRRQRTLREILAVEDLRSRLSDLEILKLCLTIVVAHENMAEVRQTTMDTSLDSYVFYQSPNSSSEQSFQDFDVTYPYLQFGFGQPSTQGERLGLGRSSPEHPDASIVNLGVILLQVATRESILGIYQKGSKMDASAQSLIERTLKKIDVQFGDGLTSAIEACIKGNARIETELVRKTAEVLKRLQDSFI
jgi:hypothetical protein